jgi:hypothetical protein
MPITKPGSPKRQREKKILKDVTEGREEPTEKQKRKLRTMTPEEAYEKFPARRRDNP